MQHGGWLRRRTWRTGSCPVSPIVRNTVAPPLRDAYHSWEMRCHSRSMIESYPYAINSAGRNPELPASPRHHAKMPWPQNDAGIVVWHSPARSKLCRHGFDTFSLNRQQQARAISLISFHPVCMTQCGGQPTYARTLPSILGTGVFIMHPE